MGGEKLWKILCKPVENFRILVLFPSFNAYETVENFQTLRNLFPSLHVRDETMKRSSCFITEYNIYHVEERT